MFGGALMDIEFSPKQATPNFLTDNDNTNSTQAGMAAFNNFGRSPLNGDLSRPPLTPSSDIFLSAALETPRYFHSASSPLPSPSPPRCLVAPPTPQQPSNDFHENSPLPPLTPFGDLPNPAVWIPTPSPPPQGFPPQLVLPTPTRNPGAEELEQEYADLNNDNVRQRNRNLQESTEAHKIKRVSTNPGKHRLGKRREEEKGEPAADLVRRRLFDMEQDDEACDSEPKTAAKSEPKPTPRCVPVSSKGSGSITPSIKIRLAPPPPIAVPGPSNTTPGGIYPIAKQRVQGVVAKAKAFRPPKIVLPFLQAKQEVPTSILQDGANPHKQKNIKRPGADAVEMRKKKSRAKPEIVEKRPIMSERASLVLAEMRRQMSEASAGGKNARVSNGTDSTNFLPYSSAVQGTTNVAKETPRTRCNCKASQCIKRYCPCFATSNFCAIGCGCRNCENTSEYSSIVGRARRVLLERDPNAFVPRIRNTQRSNARGRQTIRGCNCRKGCEKNYCICKENGLVCGVRCTCSGPKGCQNQDESKLEGVHQVIENVPRSGRTPGGFLEPKHGRGAVSIAPHVNHSRSDLKVAAGHRDAHQLHQERGKNMLDNFRVSGSRSGLNVAAGNRDAHQVHQERREKMGNSRVNHSRSGLNAAADNRDAYQVHQEHRKNILDNSTGREFGPFDVLPTPTTPSLPHLSFFEGDPASRKRALTFGNPSDSFKKIRVGDHEGNILTELKQSSSKYTGYHYQTPPPKRSAPTGSLVGTPLTSRVLSADSPPANRSNKQCPGQSINSNLVDGNPASRPSNDRQLPHVPRIFRYKFGSGKNASSFAFKS